MSFFDRIKTGFTLQKTSFTLLFRYPQLLLYWLFPGVIAGYILASPKAQMNLMKMMDGVAKTLHMQSYLYLVAIAILQIPLIIISAAFIIHVSNILINKRTTFADSFARIIRVLPWLILMPFVSELFGIAAYYLTVHYAAQFTSEEQFMATANTIDIASKVLKIVWGLLLFYALVIIVIEKVNIFKAIWRSIKYFFASWAEVISGQVCIRIPYVLLSLLYMGIILMMPTIASNPIIFTITSLLLVSIILPTRTFQVLMYHWYKGETMKQQEALSKDKTYDAF